MLLFTDRGDCREIDTKPSYRSGAGSLEGERFFVVKVGPLWEVRFRRTVRGRAISEQAVDWFKTEGEADACARRLAGIQDETD